MIKTVRTLSIVIIILTIHSCSIQKYIKAKFSEPPEVQFPEKENITRIINNNNCVIIRDKWGVPHIYGQTDMDAAFGLAYANAQDDFFTIQETVLKSRGKYSSVYGVGNNKINVIFDYMVGLLKIWELVDNKYYTDLSKETRDLCESYANGLNYYIENHSKNIEQYIYPVSGKDIIAGTVHKTPFFFQLPFFLGDLFEKKPEDIPNHYSIGQTLDIIEKIEGSNVYAVSPLLSDDKSTFLAINSHQPWDGELAWYEAHIFSNEGLNMVGGLFPGSPVVLVGHNEHLGWGHTVNKPDILDIYELEINPKNQNQYKIDEEWKNFEEFDIDINIKTIGNASVIHSEKAFWSVHGPVIKGKEATYAIKYSKAADIRIIEQWYKMNKAKNMDQWIEAMKMMSIPMFNAGYADKEGNILYIYNASIPIRNNNYNWQSVLPGNTSKTLWNEYHPFEKLPIVKNPKSGFIQNCNSSPFQTTFGKENPSELDFPKSYGIENYMTNRSLRALETFGEDEKISYEEFVKYKYDLKYSKNSNIAIIIERAIKILENDNLNTQLTEKYKNEIIDIFSNWDLYTNKDNLNAALPIIAFGKLLDINPDKISNQVIIERLIYSTEYLIKYFKSLNVRWGDINRLIRGDKNLELSGGPDIARAIYPTETKNGQLKAIAGDCYILMVKWDKNGKVYSESVHQYGSSSTNKDSKHYSDQTEIFATDSLKSISIDLDEVLNNFESLKILK